MIYIYASYVVRAVHAYEHYAHDLTGTHVHAFIVGFYSCCAACSQHVYSGFTSRRALKPLQDKESRLLHTGEQERGRNS